MNILLAAYACEPDKGSEPEVGWQMVTGLAKAMPKDNIYVITKANNKTAIENKGYAENISFIYYQLPKYISFWKKGGRGIRTYYYLWMIGATIHIKFKKLPLDIVHHITFVNDWMPSFFCFLKNNNNSFIWGPIGSHDSVNLKFCSGIKKKIVSKLTDFIKYIFRNFDPFFLICKNKADYIIGINKYVHKSLKLKGDKNFIPEPAIALPACYIIDYHDVTYEDSFNIISIGRLTYLKNFKLSILAFSKFLKTQNCNKNIKLQIIGNGEDKLTLQKLVKDLDISRHVEFIGYIPLVEVHSYLSKAKVFLFPSLENAGFVTLEAMSHSLPVVALDYGGSQQFVKNNMENQLVPESIPYSEITSRLATNLEVFFNDKELLKAVGQQNREDVLKYFTWEAKCNKISNLYQQISNEA